MRSLLLYLTLALIPVSFIHAQSDSVRTVLSETVVTATRCETPSIAVGSSFSLVTSNQIVARQLNSVDDVLRELPGLSIAQQGGPGKITHLFMRGADADETLVLIDGVAMNDPSSPDNSFDFSYLDTNDIDRIEVVRGPQSSLYGSDAMAGVVSIFTKHGTVKPEYSFFGETGSNGYYRGNLSVLGTYGLLNYSINAGRSGSNGVSAADASFGNTERDGYSNDSFTSHLGIGLLKNLSIDLMYKYTKLESALDQSGKFGDDPNYTYNLHEQIFRSGFNLSLFHGIWEQQFAASFMNNFSRSLDLPDQIHPLTSSDYFYQSRRFKIDWQNNIKASESNLITFGIESSVEGARSTAVSESEWGPYNSSFPDTSIRTTGIYFQDQINIANLLFTSVGMRYDYNDRFGGATTFRIAPAYYMNSTSTKIRISYGTGFKAPSLFYLFDPSYGNPNLQPEKSKGWDAGFEQFFLNNNLSAGITYFNLKFENMFGYDSNYREINIAAASSHGFEVTSTASIYDKLSINMNYTYTKTRDEYNDGTSDYNKPLLRRPQDQLSLNVNYLMTPKLNINFLVRYTGKRDDKDFSDYSNIERVAMPDYSLVNLGASYKLFDYLRINARVDNLFDKHYEEVLYYGTLGRSLYAGMNITF